jgi:hypothetical protein
MKIYGLSGLLATIVVVFASIGRAGAEPVGFVVLGDAPYRAERRSELHRLIDRINELRPTFSIHVGDAKSGGEPCTDAAYARVAEDLARFEAPVVFTPGDNDWTDCHRAGGPADTASDLKRLRETLFPPGANLGRAPMSLLRQSAEMPQRRVAAFERPALVVHGDDHLYCSDRPVGAPANLVRLMTFG